MLKVTERIAGGDEVPPARWMQGVLAHQALDLLVVDEPPADVFVRCLPKPKTPKEEKMKKAA